MATKAATDPRASLAEAPLTWRQYVVIGLCFFLTGLDGFDVLSISFASPGIAAEWSIDRAALGVVLSMELIGMAVGSVILGAAANRYGRRSTTLACLVVMTLGMLAAAHTGSVVQLSVVRLITGFGIGGMLACTNAITAEAANAKSRAAAVVIMAAGYPVGAIIGGSIASALLVDGTWRDVFHLGAVLSGIFIPAVLLFIPESVDFLMRRPDDGTRVRRINKALAMLGHPPVDAVATPPDITPVRSADILSGPMRQVTILLIVAYFLHVMTFYFILKWVPKIVVDMGFPASSAGGVLVWANVGGVLGALAFSVLTRFASVRVLLAGSMVASFILVSIFGRGQADLSALAWASGVAGFFTNAGMVGLYAILAAVYPAHLRAGGTGAVIGIGRGGSAVGPILAGLLFASNFGLQLTSIILAVGSLLAALIIFFLPMGDRRQAPAG